MADAPLSIKINLATVIRAFAIGTWLIFFSTKDARLHRTLGAVYLVLTTVTAISTILIRTEDRVTPMSPQECRCAAKSPL